MLGTLHLRRMQAPQPTPDERPESAQPRHCRSLWRRSVHNPICRRSLSRAVGPRFVEFTTYARASRLRASWMEARVTKVARVSAKFSKSLARRRLRPSQEEVRSPPDRLAVENCSRRAGLASRPLAQRHLQLSPDYLRDALTLELAKDVDRQAWRKVVAREIAPGAAGAQQIENGIYRRSHVVGLAWSADRQCLWDQRCQPRPLRISEIARVAGALAPINSTVLLRHIAGSHHHEPGSRQIMRSGATPRTFGSSFQLRRFSHRERYCSAA